MTDNAKPDVDLPEREVQVLEVMIDEYQKRGAPAPISALREITGLKAYTNYVLKSLQARGYVTRPHADYGRDAPYVPVKTPDGTPLRLQLVEAPEDASEMGTLAQACA